MSGAHLEYVGLYHWRLTGTHVVDIRRVEELKPNFEIVNRWIVEPHDNEKCGGSGNWKSVAEALAHAFSLATKPNDAELSLPILKGTDDDRARTLAAKLTLSTLYGRFASR